MTLEEIQAVWARFAHRADLAEDMETIRILARNRIRNRIMWWGEVYGDEEGELESMSVAPELWISAGLLEIHRLAQDDKNQANEATIFEGNAGDFMMRHSLEAGAAVAKRSDWI